MGFGVLINLSIQNIKSKENFKYSKADRTRKEGINDEGQKLDFR